MDNYFRKGKWQTARVDPPIRSADSQMVVESPEMPARGKDGFFLRYARGTIPPDRKPSLIGCVGMSATKLPESQTRSRAPFLQATGYGYADREDG
jgi:hypothetical protein